MIEARLIRVSTRQTGKMDGERVSRRRAPDRCLAEGRLGRRRTSGGLSSGNGRCAVMICLTGRPSNGVMAEVMAPFFMEFICVFPYLAGPLPEIERRTPM